MSFFDFFRSFFGVNRRNDFGTSEFGNHDSHRDSFRNPIWQSDDDDDDDDINDFRHRGSGMHFNIFNDPIEMARYFELQMDNIMKNLFGFNFPGNETIQVLPIPYPEENENLRDKMLKPATDKYFGVTNVPPEGKIDTDLDGQITAEEFSKMWNKGNVKTEKPFVPHHFSFRQSVKKEIRSYDGTVEKKQIFEDSEGNKRTIVTKEIGDKRYITTTLKDKNGVETKSETVFNIPKNELEDFTGERLPSAKNNINDDNLTQNHFPWEKFFGPFPKL